MRLRTCITILAALAIVGCTSTGAREKRIEGATRGEIGLADHEKKWRDAYIARVDSAVMEELARLTTKLADDNEAAKLQSDPARVFEMTQTNYTQFFGAVLTLASEQEKDYGFAYAMYDTGIQYSKGYLQLSAMADKELSVAKETSKAAFGAAVQAARDSWAAYNSANANKAKATVTPTPTPEVTPVPLLQGINNAITAKHNGEHHATPAPMHTPSPAHHTPAPTHTPVPSHTPLPHGHVDTDPHH